MAAKPPSSRLRVLLLWCAVAFVACAPSSHAQSCTPLGSNGPAWPRNSTVYIDLGNLNTEQQRQVRVAIQSWNHENQSNGSYVTFSFDPPLTPTSFRLSFQLGQNPVNPQTGQIPPAQIDKTGGIDGQI